MNIDDINKSTARFPFKTVKGKRGIKFRQVQKRENGTGSAIEIDHNGHDHVTIDFRNLYKKENGKIGERRNMFWTMDSLEAAQFASILLYLVDLHMRDSNESPYITLVKSEASTGFGPNWINLEHHTAIQRLELRKSRSFLFGLMRQCIETCTDETFIQFLCIQLSSWAEHADNEFAVQQAEKAIAQLGLLPPEMIN